MKNLSLSPPYQENVRNAKARVLNMLLLHVVSEIYFISRIIIYFAVRIFIFLYNL